MGGEEGTDEQDTVALSSSCLPSDPEDPGVRNAHPV